MSVMLFHFTAFKLVTALLIALYGMKHIYLASFPVLYEASPWWSIMYLAVGIGVPIMFDFVIDKTKEFIKRGKA